MTPGYHRAILLQHADGMKAYQFVLLLSLLVTAGQHKQLLTARVNVADHLIHRQAVLTEKHFS